MNLCEDIINHLEITPDEDSNWHIMATYNETEKEEVILNKEEFKKFSSNQIYIGNCILESLIVYSHE